FDFGLSVARCLRGETDSERTYLPVRNNLTTTDDVQKLDTIDSLGRTQHTNHVNESGLYALIFGSTKPEAKRFKRWVVGEVLPSIRKTGAYGVAAIDLNNAASLRTALLEYTEKVLVLEQAVEQQKPAVQFVERYVDASGSKGFRDVCKLLHAKEPEFRAFLIERNIMFRRDNRLVPYASHIDAGRLEVKAGVSNDGSGYAYTQARFTSKGIQWIAGLWVEYGGYAHSSEVA
ncbi:phage antirepressor KilAC domain-containing protein, partial [Paraburkholderia sp. GAS348]|uniref:phage antirepressor KilAC domain-containing protein n=1 Tax=Paraburkholderia sp. GAS348 TaxID=3035132 RepID=UPI003D206253